MNSRPGKRAKSARYSTDKGTGDDGPRAAGATTFGSADLLVALALWRVVPLLVLPNLPVLLKLRDDAIQVVRLDLHALCQLRNRYPRMPVNQLQSFLRPSTSTSRTPTTLGRSAGLCRSGAPDCALDCLLGVRARALQCVERLTHLGVLFDQRFKFMQTFLQVDADLAQDIGHADLPVVVMVRT